jgi:hypothetical protein
LLYAMLGLHLHLKTRVPLYKKAFHEDRLSFSYFSRPVMMRDMLRELPERVEGMVPGQVLLAHLLLPHAPYMLDGSCEPKPIKQWPLALARQTNDGIVKSYAAYWDQVACVNALLEPIFEVVKKKDFLTVIVHGDHGSRITFGTKAENESDMNMSFLAIRSPQARPNIFTQQIVLQERVVEELTRFVGH